jgi:hypothetical protein
MAIPKYTIQVLANDEEVLIKTSHAYFKIRNPFISSLHRSHIVINNGRLHHIEFSMSIRGDIFNSYMVENGRPNEFDALDSSNSHVKLDMSYSRDGTFEFPCDFNLDVSNGRLVFPMMSRDIINGVHDVDIMFASESSTIDISFKIYGDVNDLDAFLNKYHKLIT